jgi:hypothetical protein
MFKEWRINPGLDEQIFTFTPPFGAKEVELKKSVGSKTDRFLRQDENCPSSFETIRIHSVKKGSRIK